MSFNADYHHNYVRKINKKLWRKDREKHRCILCVGQFIWRSCIVCEWTTYRIICSVIVKIAEQSYYDKWFGIWFLVTCSNQYCSSRIVTTMCSKLNTTIEKWRKYSFYYVRVGHFLMAILNIEHIVVTVLLKYAWQ